MYAGRKTAETMLGTWEQVADTEDVGRPGRRTLHVPYPN